MSISTQTLFPFMRIHFFLFSFFTTWHLLPIYFLLIKSFTLERISLLGLNVGTNLSGKKTGSPVPGFLAFFGILCFIPKGTKPS